MSTNEYPFGPPSAIFDTKSTSKHAPSMPINTTNHLFSIHQPFTTTNCSHYSKKRKRCIETTNNEKCKEQTKKRRFNKEIAISSSPPPKPPSPNAPVPFEENIGFTAHGFATTMFAMLPLMNFGENNLYFPMTHANTTNYNDLFTIDKETQEMCQESSKNEENMDSVNQNIEHYFKNIFNISNVGMGNKKHENICNISNINYMYNINKKTINKQTTIVQSETLQKLKKEISHLQTELTKAKKYHKKYKKYRKLSRDLYSECIDGEKPRWSLIKFVNPNNRIIRDYELHHLREEIISFYPKNTLSVIGISKWKDNVFIEESIKKFVKLNGAYKVHSHTHISDMEISMSQIIEKFEIGLHHRVPALNGQHGIRVLRDIPMHTCFGQYFGGEILHSAFTKVFDGTAEEYDHNIYSFDQKINDDFTFIIDPFIGDWKTNELLLRYVNDCRLDIDNLQPTTDDQRYYNVEFAGIKINGWPSTFLIAKRYIKKGEELMTFYGTDFSNAIQSKLTQQQKKNERKARIDRTIVNGIKL